MPDPASQTPLPRVRLALFGKHPGWDDYVNDLGIATEQLAWAKDCLLDRGVRRVIESGVWDRLGESDRLAGYHHLLLWRRGTALLTGRLSTSHDSAGRGEAPLALLAHCERLPVLWIFEQVLPRLATLESKVGQTPVQAVARLALEGAQGELEARALSVPNSREIFPGAGSSLQRLVDHPDLGETAAGGARVGLLRVLFEIEQHMGQFRASWKGSPGSCAWLRVAKCASRPGESARVWVSLLDQELAPAIPILVIEHSEERFADIIVGEPESAVLECLRAGEKVRPLITEADVNIPKAFIQQATKKIEAWRRGATIPAGRSVEPTPPTAPALPPAPKPLPEPEVTLDTPEALALALQASGEPVLESRRAMRKRRRWKAPLGVLLALLAAGGLFLLFRSGLLSPADLNAARTNTPTPAKPPPGEAIKPVGPALTIPDTDPRPTWNAAVRLKQARDTFRSISTELAGSPQREALGGEMGATMLDTERLIGSIQDAPWTPASREAIAKDMHEVESRLGEMEHRLSGAAARAREFATQQVVRQAHSPAIVSAPLVSAWTKGLSSIDPSRGLDVALARADALDSTLARLERGVAPLVLSVPEGSAIDSGVVEKVIKSERDEALAAAAAGVLAVAPERWSQSLAIEVSAPGEVPREALRENAQRLLVDANTIELLMAQGYSHAEPGPDGMPSVAHLAQSVRDNPSFARLEGAVGPVLSRVRTVASLESELDAEMVLGVAQFAADAPPPGRASEILGAWRRLGELEWPETIADLDKAAEIYDRGVRPALDALPAERGVELRALAANTAKSMWTRFAARCADGASLDAALAKREAFGCSESDAAQIPATLRFDALRGTLRQELDAALQLPIDKSDPAARAAADRFVAGVAALGASIAQRPEVARLVEQLRTTPHTSGQDDLRRLGPGATGWRLTDSAEGGKLVTFAAPAGGILPGEQTTPRTITFRRVETSDAGRSAYLSTSEVSLGLFSSVVSKATPSSEIGLGRWPEVRPLLSPFDPRTDDPRPGPRVWTWNPNASWAWGSGDGPRRGEPMIPAGGVVSDASHGWLRPMTRPGLAYYPPDLFLGGGPAVPATVHPMQYVSPRAALFMARLTGCRLPSVDEWRRALAHKSDDAPNLRDHRWKRQYNHVRELVTYAPEFPAAGIFWPLGSEHPAVADDETIAVEADDGWLWFAPVEGAKSGFHHLIGNVAEYVVESAEDLESLAADPEAVAGALGRGEQLRVIGGSALSSPQIAVDLPAPVPFSQSMEGFSDVGFRLAFAAPTTAAVGGAAPEPHAKHLRRALDASEKEKAAP